MHIAVLNDRRTIVEMLVDARCDVLQVNKEGYNCLDIAENRQFADLCEYLEPVIIKAT